MCKSKREMGQCACIFCDYYDYRDVMMLFSNKLHPLAITVAIWTILIFQQLACCEIVKQNARLM